jgi:phosphate transport system substrate-binding protein
LSTLRFTRPRNSLLVAFLIGAFMLVFLAACGGDDDKDKTSSSSSPTGGDTADVAGFPACAPPSAGAANALTGAGATFPFPLYSKWIAEYDSKCSVKINYQSVGSGAGIQQITAKTVDFGASDGVMTEQQEAAAVAAGGPIPSWQIFT